MIRLWKEHPGIGGERKQLLRQLQVADGHRAVHRLHGALVAAGQQIAVTIQPVAAFAQL